MFYFTNKQITKKINHFHRKRVEDRKHELEYLERSLLLVNRNLQSNEMDNDDRTDPKINPKEQVSKLDEIFVKLRAATGVSKTEDVLKRFSSQQTTKEKLKKMQVSTENKKTVLEKKIQQLTAEIELRKFSESKDAEQWVHNFLTSCSSKFCINSYGIYFQFLILKLKKNFY